MMQKAAVFSAAIIGIGSCAAAEVYKNKRKRLHTKYQHWYDLWKVRAEHTPTSRFDFLHGGLKFSLKQGERIDEEKDLLRKAGRVYLEELGAHGPIDRFLLDNIWYIRSLEVMLVTAPLDARLRMPVLERDDVTDWNVVIASMYMAPVESHCHLAVLGHLLHDPAAFQNDSLHTTNVMKLRRHLQEHRVSGALLRLAMEDVYWKAAHRDEFSMTSRLIERLEDISEREEQEEE